MTDRGEGTDLERLRFAHLHLALLDLATGDTRALRIFARGEESDPRFSPDGRSLYFVGEPDGVPNVYRYDLATGAVARITNLKTGVAGLTATSPALSIDAHGTLAFSVLENGHWNVYRIRSLRAEAAPFEPPQSFRAGTLPPVMPETSSTVVEDYLANPSFGLPAERVFPRRDYTPRIQLADIGPVSVGVGTSTLGTQFLGALSAYFDDALNRHQLVTSVTGASSGGLLGFGDTFGAEVAYLNQTRRLQWGGTLSRIPYATGATLVSHGPVEVGGDAVEADIVSRLVQVATISEASVLGSYPFSLNNRLEAAVGAERIDYKQKLEQIVYPIDAAPFRLTEDLPAPDSLDLTNASVAFVRDTSEFGFVSPVRGMRLRLENRWTRGDLDFHTTHLDFRKYFLVRPVTLALRVLEIGRHGPDAEDPRLPQLDVGNPAIVHGYDLDSFDLSECAPVGEGEACPEFDRLVGSRIAALNFEVRVPLLGNEDYGLFNVPVAPTEMAFFIDAAAASSAGKPVHWKFDRNTTQRVPVVSVGLAFRTLLAGALPIELYYAVPFQRSQKDRVTGFRIAVGW